MAKLEPKKINLETINGGNRYENGDSPTPETFNDPIEASAYAQQVAEGVDSKAQSALDKATDVETRANNGEFNGKDGADGKDGTFDYIRRTCEVGDLLNLEELYITFSPAIDIDELDNKVAIAIKDSQADKEYYFYQSDLNITRYANGGSKTAKTYMTSLYNSKTKSYQFYELNIAGSIMTGGASSGTIIRVALSEESIRELNKEIENVKVKVEDMVENLIVEDTQGSEVFVPNTAVEKMPLKVLGNTTQDISPNLFIYPYPLDINKTINGVTAKVNNDGTITLNGTSLDHTIFSFVNNENGIKLSSGGYVLSGGTNDVRLQIIASDNTSDHNDYGNNEVFQNTRDTIFRANLRIEKGVTLNNEIIKPMIIKGSEPLPYQPYTGQPSPDNPIAINSVVSPISVESKGANIFDYDNIFECFVTENTKQYKIKKENGAVYFNSVIGKYTGGILMFENKHKNNTMYMQLELDDTEDLQIENRHFTLYGSNSIDNNVLTESEVIKIQNFTKGENKIELSGLSQYKYFGLTILCGKKYGIKCSNIMVSSQALPYVPYQSSTTTFCPTDINGVTHEMNGIGNVRDSIIRKDNKVYFEKRFEKVVFDGSEYWGFSYTTTSGYSSLLTDAIGKKIKRITISSTIPNLRCSMFNIRFMNSLYFENEGMGQSGGNIVIWSNYYCPEKKLAEWKAHLQAHPMEVVYELATPELYEISETEALKMQADTFSGGTYLTATSNSAEPIIDITANLTAGEHDNVVLMGRDGKPLDPHTCDDNVRMADGKSLREFSQTVATDSELKAVENKVTANTNKLNSNELVKTVEQTLTEEQQRQTKINIGSYKDFKYNFVQIANYQAYLSRTYYGLTIKNNNDGSITLTGIGNANGGVDFYRSFTYVNGHIYYISSNNSNIRLKTYGASKYVDSYILVKGAIDYNIAIDVQKGEEFNATIYPIIIDLTEMFGVGNEPTSGEDLYQYIVKDKYYPYGINIEPSMYVTKGEVNKNMMGVPSNTIINNIYELKPDARQDYVAPTNGYVVVDLYLNNNTNFISLYNYTYNYYLPITITGQRGSRIAIVKKGDVIRFSTPKDISNVISMTSKFIYSKEM